LREVTEEELLPILGYAEDNFIRSRRRDRRRQQPLFPPNIRNSYDKTLIELQRTTNICKSWHRRLNLLMGKAYPSVHHLLALLQREMAEISMEIGRTASSISPCKKKKKYVDLIKEFIELLENMGSTRITII
ncbi:hypothetical protein ANN_15270, partial [Periplaneta americana]